MLSSESQPCDVMDSKQQSLCSPFPCAAAANGSRELKQPSNSPESGMFWGIDLMGQYCKHGLGWYVYPNFVVRER